ncbi:MAG: hypothetical protein ABI451_13100 [Dokdonella sp.]
MPLRVSVAETGATFAAISVTHHSIGHVSLVKFDAAGDFQWLKERVASSLAGMVFINGHVALAGEWGTIAAPVAVSLYDAETGDLVWDRQVADGLTYRDASNETRQLTVDANGNLMLLVSDHGDYVVVRFDPDGNALPTWRRTIDPDHDVLATGIVALPDGGAVVTGQGRFLGGGYVTVRLDAQGNPVFTDVELGDIGNPLGPAHLALTADDSVIVAAAPESMGGVPRAQVWKLSSSGARLWTRVVSNPGSSTTPLTIHSLVLAADGDALIEVAGLTDPFRLLRLAAMTGVVVWDVSAPILGSPSTLALAPNGRVLVGSKGNSQESGRIAELDADGNPCRIADSPGMFSAVVAGAGSAGWSVLGATQFVPGSSPDAFVSHFDGGGACTLTDLLFKSGFE